MQYLWDHRHETVRYDDLMYALYGDDLSVRSDPRNSIDKIVRRLRAVLEPEHPGSNTYIRVQPGTGYELRNFRDTF
jgi:DNA-binding response OmpR family regulator